MRPNFVALVGAPNSGKTSLFNWLTHSKFKTVNYPGATVELAQAELASQWGGSQEEKLVLLDTPGTYSLYPKSIDEEVTLSVLKGERLEGRVRRVIVVVDGTQLSRHLILVDQLRKMGFPLVIAITMEDLLTRNGLKLNTGLIENYFHSPVVLINGLLGRGVDQLVSQVRQLPLADQIESLPPSSHEMSLRQDLDQIAKAAFGQNSKIQRVTERTEKWDRILLHPILGLVIFVSVMALLFTSIFWLATPLMDAVDAGFSWLMDIIIVGRENELWAQFLSQGLVAGLASVLVFVPQILILFFGVGILESTGYLARAATIIDRPLAKVGLSGRSFVPLLSGFACAVPAMMATRNINSARERWIANAVIPLMTCSARLPVYSLLLSFLFFNQPAWKAGVSLAVIYILSLLIGAIAAGVIHRIIKKNEKSIFMLELPLYRRPIWSVLFHQSIHRTMSYVKRAGPAIFIFAILIWAGTHFPNYHSEEGARLDSSYLANLGQQMEPVFAPMGLDWRVGVGLLSAFAAREVFVSSLAIVFSVTNENEESQTSGLLKVMSEAQLRDGSPLFTVASTLGIIVFFMIALQCMSTVAISARENHSYQYALMQLMILNVAGYVLSIAVVQGLRALGIQ